MAKTKKKPDELVTSAELARYLGVTRRTVKRYTAKGMIKPVRRHQFNYLWDLTAAVQSLHERGVCENVKPPA